MRLIAIFLFAMIYSSSVNSQATYFTRNNVIKFSPFEFARAEFKLSYERYFAERKSSILISPSLILKDEDDDKRSGIQLMGQYRSYLSHLNKANENDFLGIYNIGFYGGVYGQYLYYIDEYYATWWDLENQVQKSSTQERTINSSEVGALMGVQFDFTQRIVLDFYFGGGVRFSQSDENLELPVDAYSPDRGGIYPYGYNGVKPTIGLMLGISF